MSETGQGAETGGVFTEEQEKTIFNTEAEFRTLFHSVDVSLIKDRSDGFVKKLEQIEAETKAMSRELQFRKNFSAYLMLLALAIGIVFFMLSKTSK